MPISETLGALGSWEIQLRDGTPDYVLEQLGFFGHIAVADGPVDVAAVGDGLLTGSRYVGVLRAKDKATGRNLTGSGMLFWLGDEDGKGDILETAVNLTNATLSAAVTAIVGPSTAVDVGTVHPIAGTYTGKHQFQTRREALGIICDAFGAEFRVNGNGTVDVGTAAQLYNTEAPDTIIVRRATGADMDLVALGGDYTVDESVYDYSTRVVLLGQTIGAGDEPDQVFATGSANAPAVPYKDLFGNPVKLTRTISESGTTTGSVAARAQLQLNRFNRVARSLKVSAADFETEGNFVVGDNVYVYDPETGIANAANEVTFQGEVLHPDVVRASGATWPVVEGMTVAFRTQAGVWVDLTPFVLWEWGGHEFTVGDLPKSLTRPGDNPVQVRLDGATGTGFTKTPKTPTGLTLSTFSVVSGTGNDTAIITAEWDPVTQNTDNTSVALSHYEVRYRPSFRAQWLGSRVSAEETADLPAVAELEYDVAVRAVTTSNRASAWSAPVTILSAADDTAPPSPSDPVVTNYIGLLRVAWDGLSSVGGPMPPDFNRVDVHVGTSSGFTPDATTLLSSLSGAGTAHVVAPYGSPRFIRLIPYDHTGNPGPASGTVQAATVQANDGDIATLNVGKLTSGEMTADVVMAGRHTTALTGARREMNAIGFQAWDASNNLLINLDGVNNLLTGRFRTALTGRRIELGAAGSSGAVDFIAQDGTTTKVQSFTSSLPTSGVECLAMRVPIAGTYGAWNSLQIQENQRAFLLSASVHVNYGGTATGGGEFRVEHATDKGTATTPPQLDARLIINETNGTRFYDNGNRLRMVLSNSGGWQVWDGDDLNNTGDRRIEVANDWTRIYGPAGPNNSYLGQPQFDVQRDRTTIRARTTLDGDDSAMHIRESVAPGSSVHIQLQNRNAFGGRIKYYYLAGDIGGERMEIRSNTDSGFIPLWASTFVENSDREMKTDIGDLSFSPLERLRTLRPREYMRMGGEGVPTLPRIGFVADEMPSGLVVGNPADAPSGIDLMAVVATTVGAVQQIDSDLAGLRKELAVLRNVLPKGTTR